LIVSVHVPKTAGKSFRLRLEAAFGPRLLRDYADWIGLDVPEARAQRAEQAARMRACRDRIFEEYDIIYGQFIADKYLGVFPAVAFTIFLRDPYQQAVSHYQFALCHPEIDHPWVRKFHELRPTMPELIAALPNLQSAFLGSVPLEDFAVIGLREQYERSVALFEAVFRRRLPPETVRANVNPLSDGDYPIDPTVRRAVDMHRASDVELYRRARERFAQLASSHGI
jgi:hypothetical protein